MIRGSVGQRCREAYIAVPEVSGNPTLAQQRCLVCNIAVGRLNAKLWFSATQARQRCWLHQHRCWAGLARPMVGLVMPLADVKNGQICHFVNDLLSDGLPPKNLRLYFFDTDQQIEDRMRTSDRLDKNIVSTLVQVISDNSYSRFFKSLKDVCHDAEFSIRLNDNCDSPQSKIGPVILVSSKV
ncbi:hypothetical protein DM860_017632 [Cuscuta australis]|uniref:Uncharacterized protein n=1 Tax=Cuscuta australis TaxID=267555 RepID=A0A328DQE2_9ASTE|nr:hypothetical protein DM860_017632 [Cuscuta australis]